LWHSEDLGWAGFEQLLGGVGLYGFVEILVWLGQGVEAIEQLVVLGKEIIVLGGHLGVAGLLG
jgi:hypothetical protein